MVSFDVSAYESVDADAAASGRLPLTFRQITRVMVHILERLREPPLSASDASPMHARPEDNDDGLGGDGASATAAFVLQILVHPHEIAIPRAAFGSIVICLLRMLPFNLVPATTLTPVVPFAAAPILKALARRSRHEVGARFPRCWLATCCWHFDDRPDMVEVVSAVCDLKRYWQALPRGKEKGGF